MFLGSIRTIWYKQFAKTKNKTTRFENVFLCLKNSTLKLARLAGRPAGVDRVAIYTYTYIYIYIYRYMYNVYIYIYVYV